MAQSRPRGIGRDVHTETMAVANVAHDQGAEGMSLGRMGTRQGAIDPRVRTRPSQATHRLVGSEAGPWCGA